MDKKVLEYDVAILGGGPAGLSAGVYAARAALKCAVIDITMFGGQPSNYADIENYLGFPEIGGFELSEKFEEHFNKFGAEKYPMQEIISVNLISNPKIIETKEYIFKSKTIILAMGAGPKKLGIPGEKEYTGRGVSYCAVCDGAFYKDKEVAVIGGGNTAVEEGIYLTRFAKKVYIIHRRDTFRADKILVKRAQENPKIEFIYDTIPLEIHGSAAAAQTGIGGDKVNCIVLKNVKTDEVTKLNIDGVFPFIGVIPNTELVNGQIKQDGYGFILTDERMAASEAGVFAAGDIRTTPLRQVITAVSDGAVSASYAAKYIEENALSTIS